MPPYRDPTYPPPAPPAAVAASDDAIGVVLIVIGAVPVLATGVVGGDFGAEPTLGLGLLVVGLWTALRRR